MFGIYKLRRRVTELEIDRDFLLRQAREKNTGHEKELNWLRDRITALEVSRPVLIAADDYARLLKLSDRAHHESVALLVRQAQTVSPNKIENRN